MGARKTYRIQAFLFWPTNLENHAHAWEFHVDGLSTLPNELVGRVTPVVGPIKNFDAWEAKLTNLRNSLSQHGGDHGTARFDAVSSSDVTFPVRVFANILTEALDSYVVHLTLVTQDDPGPIILEKTFRGTDVLEMVAKGYAHIVAYARTDDVEINLRATTSRLMKSIHNGHNQTQVGFMLRDHAYTAIYRIDHAR